MSSKAGNKAAYQMSEEPRPTRAVPDAINLDEAGEAEPKGMPTSDRMATETAHHHPSHDGGARNDGAPGPAPRAENGADDPARGQP